MLPLLPLVTRPPGVVSVIALGVHDVEAHRDHFTLEAWSPGRRRAAMRSCAPGNRTPVEELVCSCEPQYIEPETLPFSPTTRSLGHLSSLRISRAVVLARAVSQDGVFVGVRVGAFPAGSIGSRLARGSGALRPRHRSARRAEGRWSTAKERSAVPRPSRSHHIRRTAAEQDAEAWWQAIGRCARKAVATGCRRRGRDRGRPR